MGSKVKSLLLFNLDDIIASKVHELILFITKFSIKNQRDIGTILIYYILTSILQTHRNTKGMVLFYMSQKCCDWLEADSAIVRDMDFKRVIDVFLRKIKFPIIVSTLSFNDFEKLLNSNSPEYEEIINHYDFLSHYFNEVIKLIKKLEFYSLEEELVKNLTEIEKVLSI